MPNEMKYNIKIITFILGSNLGDRESNLSHAIKSLEMNLDLQEVRQSSPLENKALLKPNSPKKWDRDFLNIAASGKIDLEEYPPQKILTIIHEIERKLGRTRDGSSWAPRTIDIDIAFIENMIFDEDNLQIPHKELTKRDFFLIPLSQIESDWKYPAKGKYHKLSIGEILDLLKN